MDYEKKYKKLVGKIEKAYLYAQTDSTKAVLEEIRPELKESEDEKTRKRVIALVNAHGQGMYKGDMLAWLENIPYTIDHEKREGFHLGYKAGLEKQDEQKFPVETITTEESLGIDSETYNKIVDECIYGDDKQKPAWNESDEEMRKNIEVRLHTHPEIGISEFMKSCYWLKSLKQRYTWKPTEEQMKALHDMNLTGNISYVGQGQELINLYNDLKKLKGE